MTPLTLLAEARTEQFLKRPEDWVVVGSLAGVLLLGALVVWFVDRWRKRSLNDDRQAGEELTDFRGMFERGEITEAEYEKLRAKVAARVKAKLSEPKKPPAADEPPPPPAVPPIA